jgi:hypothetical protein
MADAPMSDEEFAKVAAYADEINRRAKIKDCEDNGHQWGSFLTYPLENGLALRGCKHCGYSEYQPRPGVERHWAKDGETYSGPPLGMDEIVI